MEGFACAIFISPSLQLAQINTSIAQKIGMVCERGKKTIKKQQKNNKQITHHVLKSNS